MVRRDTHERLTAVAEASTEVFGRLGYRGTRMADVAAAAGMSAGSIFNYVESKEALFHLVFAYGFSQLGDPVLLPLPTPAPGETVALISESVRAIRAPRLQAALADSNPSEVATELRRIVEERYSIVERHWPLFAVIERCAVEMPDLEEFYFQRTRSAFFAGLARYLEARGSAGVLRPMPDAAVTARIISETIAWFAWKRHQGRDALLFDDELTRRTVVEFVCAALLEPPL